MPGIEPTPLVIARLVTRMRGARAELITVFVCTAGLVAWVAVDPRFDGDTTPQNADLNGLGWSIAVNAVLVLTASIGLWHRHRAEDARLAGMTVRTAHPSAADVRQVLGPASFNAAVAAYGGGLALGAITALLAPKAGDRMLGLAFLIGVVVFIGLAVLNLAVVLRRPALAEDADSLRVDDVLRSVDARSVVGPYPAIAAVVAGVSTTDGSWLIWPFLCYAAVGFFGWAFAQRPAACRVVAVQ
jgi:hypothetical protein